MSVREATPLAPSLASLVEDYGAYLSIKKGRARSASHRARVALCLKRMLDGAERLQDVTPDWVERRMQDFLELPAREGQRLSRNTVDLYRNVLGTFFRWLCRKRRLLRVNPVDHVDPLEKEDLRRVSRSFSQDELPAFWVAVPKKRRLVYLTWATTGLRPSESGRLTWPDVILDPADGGPAHFVLRCSLTKNGRRERQPLHPALVTLLRDARKAAAGERVFPTIPTNTTFARDLRAAGLWETRETAEGRLTRYSLRKTFITALVSDEKNSQVAHKLARHSDPKLTYGTYTTFDLRRKAQAVEALAVALPLVSGGGDL